MRMHFIRHVYLKPGLKGRQKHLKFQEPDEELYSIFDVVKTIFWSGVNCDWLQAFLSTLVELYPEGTAKLNST